MAYFGKGLAPRGLAIGREYSMASRMLRLSGQGLGTKRDISSSQFTKSSGSLLGKYAVKTKTNKLVSAFSQIQEREKLMRLQEMAVRHSYHEKGFEKKRRKKKFNDWRQQYKTVHEQAKWMSILRSKGVPIPGEKKMGF